MKKIIRNAAQCALCDTVIESTHRHDFRYCKCGAIFVDGGREYLRRGALDFAHFIDLSEQIETCRCGGTGFTYVDDGNGCVVKEPCDHCEVFDARVHRQANA